MTINTGILIGLCVSNEAAKSVCTIPNGDFEATEYKHNAEQWEADRGPTTNLCTGAPDRLNLP